MDRFYPENGHLFPQIHPHLCRERRFWGSTVLARLPPTPRYQVSQRKRKRSEEIFGRTKTAGRGRELRYKRVERNHLWAEMTVADCSLVRMRELVAVPA
jgi:hypothetical protein